MPTPHVVLIHLCPMDVLPAIEMIFSWALIIFVMGVGMLKDFLRVNLLIYDVIMSVSGMNFCD